MEPRMAKSIRILCADDHQVMRDGIAFALESQQDMELVGEASNGEEAVRLFQQLRPDVTLMDLQMPGMNGVEALEAIRSINPHAKVIVITTYSGDVRAHHALVAGAAGYLLKHMLRTDLIRTIRSVQAGERPIPTQVATSIVEQLGSEPLSEREIDVLRAVSDGNTNKVIAGSLNISEDTVKGHLKNILHKLGANDRTHAVTLAIKRGFLDILE
jgi:DNA-binding NarL/FixJ family response regulator